MKDDDRSIKFGGDPEFFLEKNGEIISADEYLPDKRNKPEYQDFFFDGVQAEINPKQSFCREIFIQHIQDVLNSMLNEIKEKDSKTPDFKLYPSTEIDKDTIKNSDLECRRFGCSPSFNIYNPKRIEYPDASEHMIRYAGGHFHLGGINSEIMRFYEEPSNIKDIIKLFDYLVGTYTVATTPYPEKERVRRKYYGRAGSYRKNGHGIEYRTLSPVWMIHPAYTSVILGLFRLAHSINFANEEKDVYDLMDEKEVIDIINNVKVEKAKNFWMNKVYPYLDKLEEEINSNINKHCPLTDSRYRRCLNNLFDNPLELWPDNIYLNWDLKCAPSLPYNGFITWYEDEYLG